MKVGTKVRLPPPPLLNVAPGRVSCLTHLIARFSSARIIGAPVTRFQPTDDGRCRRRY